MKTEKISPERMEWPTWKQAYSVGVELLDSQHQYMFELGKKISGLRPEHAKDVVRSLYEYLLEHCAAEEAHMADIGFPGLDAHREKHVEILAQLRIVANRGDASARDVLKMKTFYYSWLVNHVLNTDRQYFEFAQKQTRSEMTPDNLARQSS